MSRSNSLFVQYPGVAESIDSDIDNLMSVLKYGNLLPEGKDSTQDDFHAQLICISVFVFQSMFTNDNDKNNINNNNNNNNKNRKRKR